MSNPKVLNRVHPRDLIMTRLSMGQKKLKSKHGTPAEFASSVYQCVPWEISMDEAEAAVRKYNQEWTAASL